MLKLYSVTEINETKVPLRQQKISSCVSTSPTSSFPNCTSLLLFFYFFTYGEQGLPYQHKVERKNFYFSDYKFYIVGDVFSCEIVQIEFFEDFRSRNRWNFGR